MATVTGTSGNDNLAGTAPDLLGTVSGADLISGLQGNDNITGFGGQDSLYGGQGNDDIVYGGPVQLTSDPNRTLVYGGLGSDNVISNGSRGINTIYGGAGTSADSTDGGNLIDVRNDTGADVIYAGGGGDTIQLGNTVIGSTVTGGAGNDIVTASTNGSSRAFVLGNMGNDTLTGSAFGADTLYGGKGDDSIAIGSGIVATSGSLVSSDLGNDTIFDTTDAPFSGNSASFADSLYGGQGNDSIRAGSGGVNELIFGGLDSDTITLTGNGTHTVYGGSDTLGAAADGANTILGTSSVGNTTNRDLYVGGGGTDSIVASNATGAGDSTSGGGASSDNPVDTLTGGGGNDTFSFAAATGSEGYGNFVAGANLDTAHVDSITDFVSGSDKIRVNGFQPANVEVLASATQTTINNSANLFAAATAAATGLTTAGDATVFTYSGSNYLFVDAAASKSFNVGDDLIKINATTLTKGDFIA